MIFLNYEKAISKETFKSIFFKEKYHKKIVDKQLVLWYCVKLIERS